MSQNRGGIPSGLLCHPWSWHVSVPCPQLCGALAGAAGCAGRGAGGAGEQPGCECECHSSELALAHSTPQTESLLSPRHCPQQHSAGLLCLPARLGDQGRSLAEEVSVGPAVNSLFCLRHLVPLPLSGGLGCLLESCLLTGKQNYSFYTKTIVLQAVNSRCIILIQSLRSSGVTDKLPKSQLPFNLTLLLCNMLL